MAVAPIIIDTASMVASLRSVFEHLAASRGALERFAQFFGGVFVDDGAGGFDLTDDGIGLLLGEVIGFPASRAGERQVFEFHPSDRYLKAVAAVVTGNGQADVVLSHGWPILSVGSGTPTVAEAGGVTSAPGGGAL